MEKHELICINCPLGCRLEVTNTPNGGWLVEGNQCKRGYSYAIRELTEPTRVLTTTVVLKNGFLPRLPVKTESPIPKEKVFQAMEIIDKVVMKAPVKAGDIVVENILDTGVNVIASRSMS